MGTNVTSAYIGPVVNFSIVLRPAFAPVAPKSVRIQSSCQYLFTLLGSTGTKAVRRTVMKLTPRVGRIDRPTVVPVHGDVHGGPVEPIPNPVGHDDVSPSCRH